MTPPRVKKVDQLSIPEIKNSLIQSINENLSDLVKSMDEESISNLINSQEEDLNTMIRDDTWIKGYNGKYIFQKICGEIFKADQLQVRHAYIDIAINNYPEKIQELTDLFKDM